MAFSFGDDSTAEAQRLPWRRVGDGGIIVLVSDADNSKMSWVKGTTRYGSPPRDHNPPEAIQS